jgi:hypothetical protein
MGEKFEIGLFITFFLGIFIYFTFIDTIYYVDLKGFLKETPVFFVPTLLVSLLALYFASKNYLRKSGVSVAATYGTQGNFSSKDSYISSVILVNRKDKPLIIRNFYLKISENLFIKLNSDSGVDDYITLKPYESLVHKLPPRLGYFCNMRKVIGINDILNNDKIKKQVVLDTTEGIVRCKSLKFKNVMLQALTNHYTAYIVGHGGKFINERPVGDNVLYFIELVTHNDLNSFLTITPDKKENYLDGKLIFDHEILWSDTGKSHVEEVLNEAITKGVINWKSFTVHSQLHEANHYKQYDTDRTIDLRDLKYHGGIFQYYFLGNLRSYLKRKSMQRKNKKMNQSN